MTKTNRIKAVKKTVYCCSICGTEYNDRKKAEEICGSLELEPPRFKVGDEVIVGAGGYPGAIAKVTHIIGPVIGNKCRQDGQRLIFTGAHVYQYKVKPLTKTILDIKDWHFWTSELSPIRV